MVLKPLVLSELSSTLFLELVYISFMIVPFNSASLAFIRGTGLKTQTPCKATREAYNSLRYSPVIRDSSWLRQAEDNLVNQKLAVKILEKYGHSVEIAENGSLAVEAFKGRVAQGRPFDIILMDVFMPFTGGMEATELIRSFTGQKASQLSASATVCNIHAVFCERPYGNTTFLGSHESYAFSTSDLLALSGDQEVDIPTLLGCLLSDGGTIVDYLTTVKTWLDAVPNRVLTLIHELGRTFDSGRMGSCFRCSRRKRVITFTNAGADDADGAPVDSILPEFTMLLLLPLSAVEQSWTVKSCCRSMLLCHIQYEPKKPHHGHWSKPSRTHSVIEGSIEAAQQAIIVQRNRSKPRSVSSSTVAELEKIEAFRALTKEHSTTISTAQGTPASISCGHFIEPFHQLQLYFSS
ncbi:hypothetical protein EV361DRAFT_1004215 [Lentinula raphanica]|nr:hypothetical protein EV361DRAFT_1004215 [Lentinula raphanica]